MASNDNTGIYVDALTINEYKYNGWRNRWFDRSPATEPKQIRIPDVYLQGFDKEQQLVMRAVVEARENVFYTGAAGEWNSEPVAGPSSFPPHRVSLYTGCGKSRVAQQSKLSETILPSPGIGLADICP